jgi:hypothetical protein
VCRCWLCNNNVSQPVPRPNASVVFAHDDNVADFILSYDAGAAEISLQLRVFRLGLFQDGDVGIGVFPEGEEVPGGNCARARTDLGASSIYFLPGGKSVISFHAAKIMIKPI